MLTDLSTVSPMQTVVDGGAINAWDLFLGPFSGILRAFSVENHNKYNVSH